MTREQAQALIERDDQAVEGRRDRGATSTAAYTGEHPLRRQPHLDRGRRRATRSSTSQSCVRTEARGRRRPNDLSDAGHRARRAAVGGAREARARRSGGHAAARRRRQYDAGERVLRLDGEPRRRRIAPRAALTALEPRARRAISRPPASSSPASAPARVGNKQGTVRVSPRDDANYTLTVRTDRRHRLRLGRRRPSRLVEARLRRRRASARSRRRGCRAIRSRSSRAATR